MSETSRRSFLKSAGAGAAATSVVLSTSRSGWSAPNERVRHAVIGVGSQGGTHCKNFSRLEDECEVVAVCDVDPERLAEAREDLPNSERVQAHDDFRRLLEDESIDSVSVTTPDHWHTPVALAALAAGKHVYVEKPCCHNIREGQLLVEAAAQTGKCVQHGTQSRSGKGIQDAMQFIREGGIGEVRMAKAINHQLRKPVGRAPETDPPPGVNYDMWLGPAPKHAYTKNRWHYNWHWFWDYGTGDTGNDGIHQIDVGRWGLGVDFPTAVSVSGGQLFYDDDHETPDTQMITYEYADCYLVFEMRLWTDYKMEGHDNGTVFYGDKGKLEVGRQGCHVTLIDQEKKKIGGGSDLGANIRNFLGCIKDNAPSKLNAPATEAFASATLCHLANIGTRVGRKLFYDSNRHRFIGDRDTDRLLTRNYRKGYELTKVV